MIIWNSFKIKMEIVKMIIWKAFKIKMGKCSQKGTGETLPGNGFQVNCPKEKIPC